MMKNGSARKGANGLAPAHPANAPETPWRSAAQQVEAVLGEIFEALIGHAVKGSLPHAKYLIEFAQAAKAGSPANEGGGEIARLLDDLFRDDPPEDAGH